MKQQMLPAWAAVSKWVTQIDFSMLIERLGADNSAIAWLWLLEYAEHAHPAYPLMKDGVMQINASVVLQQTPHAAGHPYHASRDQACTSLQEVAFNLTCATANVLTLYQNKAEHGRGLTARAEALLRSFASENVMVVGVQETRSQMQGHTICLDYHILASPATSKGVGGVQLWVKRKWKTSRGDISISTADLRILVADSQYMLVKLSHDELRLLFLVAHAPKGPAFEAATAYWDQLSHAIPASMRSWPLIGLLDANARVGSMTSHAIGSHGQDHENIAGECFHQWLHDQSLFLPQMFAEYHHGDHDTWTHSSGTTARLDYIAVDQSLRHDKIPTCIANVDLALHHADHCSVQASIPIRCQVAEPQRSNSSSTTTPCMPHNFLGLRCALTCCQHTEMDANISTSARKSLLSEASFA
jgi:exonuclease III